MRWNLLKSVRGIVLYCRHVRFANGETVEKPSRRDRDGERESDRRKIDRQQLNQNIKT